MLASTRDRTLDGTEKIAWVVMQVTNKWSRWSRSIDRTFRIRCSAALCSQAGWASLFIGNPHPNCMQRYVFTANDGKKVVFREPRSTDARPLMEFINAFVEEERSGLLINKETKIREERRWLKSRLKSVKQKTVVMLVVERDGKIVGNCDVERRIWKESHRASLGIALSREIRGIGVGEELIKRIVALAKQRMHGLERLDLQVIDYNKRAKGLYRKVGFEKVARMPNAVKEGREYFDEDWMILRV